MPPPQTLPAPFLGLGLGESAFNLSGEADADAVLRAMMRLSNDSTFHADTPLTAGDGSSKKRHRQKAFLTDMGKRMSGGRESTGGVAAVPRRASSASRAGMGRTGALSRGSTPAVRYRHQSLDATGIIAPNKTAGVLLDIEGRTLLLEGEVQPIGHRSRNSNRVSSAEENVSQSVIRRPAVGLLGSAGRVQEQKRVNGIVTLSESVSASGLSPAGSSTGGGGRISRPSLEEHFSSVGLTRSSSSYSAVSTTSNLPSGSLNKFGSESISQAQSSHQAKPTEARRGRSRSIVDRPSTQSDSSGVRSTRAPLGHAETSSSVSSRVRQRGREMCTQAMPGKGQEETEGRVVPDRMTPPAAWSKSGDKTASVTAEHSKSSEMILSSVLTCEDEVTRNKTTDTPHSHRATVSPFISSDAAELTRGEPDAKRADEVSSGLNSTANRRDRQRAGGNGVEDQNGINATSNSAHLAVVECSASITDIQPGGADNTKSAQYQKDATATNQDVEERTAKPKLPSIVSTRSETRDDTVIPDSATSPSPFGGGTNDDVVGQCNVTEDNKSRASTVVSESSGIRSGGGNARNVESSSAAVTSVAGSASTAYKSSRRRQGTAPDGGEGSQGSLTSQESLAARSGIGSSSKRRLRGTEPGDSISTRNAADIDGEASQAGVATTSRKGTVSVESSRDDALPRLPDRPRVVGPVGGRGRDSRTPPPRVSDGKANRASFASDGLDGVVGAQRGGRTLGGGLEGSKRSGEGGADGGSGKGGSGRGIKVFSRPAKAESQDMLASVEALTTHHLSMDELLEVNSGYLCLRIGQGGGAWGRRRGITTHAMVVLQPPICTDSFLIRGLYRFLKICHRKHSKPCGKIRRQLGARDFSDIQRGHLHTKLPCLTT